ncbi:hypothetical protein F8M41_005390 [Gigaspora margarita]|uniref:Uncharacterized protein n=1 Tax=Gigaspora margarita TaxID=4874 RepID=A0A8H3XB64_GIGMA|nr:hypothetical protein F8M41_005390 [Gigaspora margarita]
MDIECICPEGFGFRIERRALTRIYLYNGPEQDQVGEYRCRYETGTEYNKFLEPDKNKNCFLLTKATTKCEIIDKNSATLLVSIKLM